MAEQKVQFYGHPQSRARTIYWMLEEVGAPYELTILDLKNKENKTPEFLKINPLGKIPTIVHKGITVTESAAICAYLADAFPDKKLAPDLSSPVRGEYYRWLFFMGSCFEPSILDEMMKVSRPPDMAAALGYGSLKDILTTLEDALADGPYLLGSEFSAADVYTASQLWWASTIGILKLPDVLSAYLKNCQSRSAYQKSLKILESPVPAKKMDDKLIVQGP